MVCQTLLPTQFPCLHRTPGQFRQGSLVELRIVGEQWFRYVCTVVEITQQDHVLFAPGVVSSLGAKFFQCMMTGSFEQITSDRRLDRNSTRLNSSHVAISYA